MLTFYETKRIRRKSNKKQNKKPDEKILLKIYISFIREQHKK